MTVELDRIPALQLTLADLVWDDNPAQQRWLGIVALAVDGDHVVVTGAGDEEVLRMPANALVRVRRMTPTTTRDDTGSAEQISGYYPGDIASARAAFAAHSGAPQPPAAATSPYPNANYEGLYGGDLDHVVDAVGGIPDERTRDLRDAATRRHLADSHDEPGPDAPTPESDEELAERLSGWYAGDIGHIVDSQEP